MAAITPAWVRTHYEGDGRRRIEAFFTAVDSGDTWAHGIPAGKLISESTRTSHPTVTTTSISIAGIAGLLCSGNGEDMTVDLRGTL